MRIVKEDEPIGNRCNPHLDGDDEVALVLEEVVGVDSHDTGLKSTSHGNRNR